MPAPQSIHVTSQNATSAAYVCLYVPDFAVEALLRLEPELRSQAVVVLEGKPPLQKAYAVNEKARACGVTPGMTKLQLEASPELVLRPRSLEQEAAAHAALLDCAQSFSPRVEDTAADTVILDVSGLESLFGPLAKLARDVARRASDLGLEVNVAVAASPDSARLAACGFAGVTVIPEGKEAEQLGSLHVEVLFTGTTPSPISKLDPAQMLDILERWGVRNLRGLAMLPDVALSERLGQDGVRFQKLARGIGSRTIVPVDPPLVFEEVIELEHPILLLEPLAFVLNRLLEQICNRLSSRALATQQLTLEMQLDSSYDHVSLAEAPRDRACRQTFMRTLRLPVPLLDPKVFLKLLQLDLRAHPPGAPIVKVHLSAEPSRPRAAQAGLFTPPAPEPEKLELTLARIAGIVGEHKVGSVCLLDTYAPEGFRMTRFAPQQVQPRAPRRKKEDAEGDSHKEDKQPSIAALRIRRPPARVLVTMRGGKPVHVLCQKYKHLNGSVIWAAGPWRASGNWWDAKPWARDEWDIALESQSHIALYRLVRDLLSGHWFIEGSYD
jgi:protein ImuB